MVCATLMSVPPAVTCWTAPAEEPSESRADPRPIGSPLSPAVPPPDRSPRGGRGRLGGDRPYVLLLPRGTPGLCRLCRIRGTAGGPQHGRREDGEPHEEDRADAADGV